MTETRGTDGRAEENKKKWTAQKTHSLVEQEAGESSKRRENELREPAAAWLCSRGHTLGHTQKALSRPKEKKRLKTRRKGGVLSASTEVEALSLG